MTSTSPIVIDPAFDETPDGEVLRAIGSRYGVALRTHAGFVLAVDAVPDDFRGPRMRPLARRISDGTHVDAAILGRAAAALERDPAAWADWDDYEATLQHLKQLWHVLVRYGAPRGGDAAIFRLSLE